MTTTMDETKEAMEKILMGETTKSNIEKEETLMEQEKDFGDETYDEEDDGDDYEYEYEDEDAANVILDNPALAAAQLMEQAEQERIAKAQQQVTGTTMQSHSMLLRAEKETSGGKRRLMQDLSRIMNQDTVDAGFSIEPTSEDSMEKWTIKLFQFDEDSDLAKDMKVVGISNVELEMTFPDQYPFAPPFVRVTHPRFKERTGHVLNGAICMELLTSDGWNPVNDIESIIVSVRAQIVVGNGRLQAAQHLSTTKYNAMLAAAEEKERSGETELASDRSESVRANAGGYSATEARAAYVRLTDFHKKQGWTGRNVG